MLSITAYLDFVNALYHLVRGFLLPGLVSGEANPFLTSLSVLKNEFAPTWAKMTSLDYYSILSNWLIATNGWASQLVATAQKPLM